MHRAFLNVLGAATLLLIATPQPSPKPEPLLCHWYDFTIVMTNYKRQQPVVVIDLDTGAVMPAHSCRKYSEPEADNVH